MQQETCLPYAELRSVPLHSCTHQPMLGQARPENPNIYEGNVVSYVPLKEGHLSVHCQYLRMVFLVYFYRGGFWPQR